MKCPICDHELEYNSYYFGYNLMEDESKCNNCKRYIERFDTGSYEIGVKTNGGEFEDGWNIWQWSYDSPLFPSEKQARDNAVEQAKKEL